MKPSFPIAVGACLLASAGCFAESIGEDMPSLPDPLRIILRVWPIQESFHGKMALRLINASLATEWRMQVECAHLDGSTRVDFDSSKARLSGINREKVAEARSIGLDPSIMIDDVDTGLRYWICPKLGAYLETELPMSDSVSRVGSPRKVRFLGDEVVHGHRCKKWAAVCVSPDGKDRDAVVWEAQDLRNFPIRIRFERVVVDFIEVKLERPSRLLFVPPSEYRRCLRSRELWVAGK